MIKSTVEIKVTTTGSAGVATGSAVSESISGYVESVYLNFHASAPATTDTTIAFTLGGNILVVSNSATDVRKYPRATAFDNANAAITNSHLRFPINDSITVSLAQCDALTDAVVVTVVIASC